MLKYKLLSFISVLLLLTCSYDFFKTDFAQLPDYDDLILQVNTDASDVSDLSKITAIYNIVLDRFPWDAEHPGEPTPKYTISSNWVAALLGLFDERLSEIRLPEYILQQRMTPACSELSFLMVSLSESVGVRSRHVGLNGHVVMEAFYDGKWHMYDPLYGVSPADFDGSDLSVATLENNISLARDIYSKSIKNEQLLAKTVEFFVSGSDNIFATEPRLSQFNQKGTLLMYFEQVSHYLKWLLPVVSLFGCLIFSNIGQQIRIVSKV